MLALAIVCSVAMPGYAQQKPGKIAIVRLHDLSPSLLNRVKSLGIDVRVDLLAREAVLFVDELELENLRREGYSLQVLHEDAESYFAGRLDASLGPGSMGGYYTLAEVVEKLDTLADSYPDIISRKISVGTSIEGREIWAIVVSDDPDPLNPDPNRPAVFYNSLIHAREPIGMMLLFGFIEDLVRKQREGDPGVHYLLSSRELWFVLVINPDGYYYNEVERPQGGGMWRKNKRDNNEDGIFSRSEDGVDLNRNFGFHWGEDDLGSSPNPGSGTYRGTSPFSEPETQAVQDVFDMRSPGVFQLVLNYHSYSNVYLHPWGYMQQPVDNLTAFQEWAGRMSIFNHYPYGTGTDMIGYHTNGGAADWEYGSEGVMGIIPEVGTWYDYFWPPTIRIPAIVREQIGPNYITAWMAGGVLLVDDIEIDDSRGNNNGHIESGEVVELRPLFTNAGMSQSVSGAVASLTALGMDASVLEGSVVLGDFNVNESRLTSDPFEIRVESVPEGRRLEFALMVEADGDYTRIDTIGVFVGQPLLLLDEDWESGIVGWAAEGGFGLSQRQVFEGSYSISDAPSGIVLSGESWLDLNSPINLVGFDGATLRFRSKSMIGPRNMAMVMVGPEPYPRPYPKSGNTDADPVVFFTTGTRDLWEEVEIDLTPFVNTPGLWLGWYSGYFQFPESEGWSIDDIRLEAWTSASGETEGWTESISLGLPYPNPANPATGANISMRADLTQLSAGLNHVTLRVYDVRGRLVATVFDGTLQNRVYEGFLQWNGRDAYNQSVASGIYLLELRTGHLISTKKVLILR